MSMEMGGCSVELWAPESRVPHSTPFLAVLAPSRGRIKCLVLHTLFQHYGMDLLVNIRFCPSVWLFQSQTHSHLPHLKVPEGAQDTR